jgi:hypothetical protein
VTPLELLAFIALVLAAGVIAIVRKENPLRLLWIAGSFLLASMCVAVDMTHALSALVELFGP